MFLILASIPRSTSGMPAFDWTTFLPTVCSISFSNIQEQKRMQFLRELDTCCPERLRLFQGLYVWPVVLQYISSFLRLHLWYWFRPKTVFLSQYRRHRRRNCWHLSRS